MSSVANADWVAPLPAVELLEGSGTMSQYIRVSVRIKEALISQLGGRVASSFVLVSIHRRIGQKEEALTKQVGYTDREAWVRHECAEQGIEYRAVAAV